MATKLAKRDTRGYWNEFRSTKVTKSMLLHAEDENEAECENVEMWQHQFGYRFNCI